MIKNRAWNNLKTVDWTVRRKPKKICEWEVTRKPKLATFSQLEKTIINLESIVERHKTNESIRRTASNCVEKLRAERAERIGKHESN